MVIIYCLFKTIPEGFFTAGSHLDVYLRIYCCFFLSRNPRTKNKSKLVVGIKDIFHYRYFVHGNSRHRLELSSQPIRDKICRIGLGIILLLSSSYFCLYKRLFPFGRTIDEWPYHRYYTGIYERHSHYILQMRKDALTSMIVDREARSQHSFHG